VVESDDEDTSLISPVLLGKKGEQLARCGRQAFSANPVNKSTTANTETLKTRTNWAANYWRLAGLQALLL
jgi:hypothetical protein